MHNLKANFDKILEQITPFAPKMVNGQGNIPRCGVVPKFSDLEVVALSMTAEALSIDSENLLFQKLQAYKSDFSNPNRYLYVAMPELIAQRWAKTTMRWPPTLVIVLLKNNTTMDIKCTLQVD